MFTPDFPLTALRAAPYNPRLIEPARAAALRESLDCLGPLKAVVVASDGLLLAGHQRTAQLRAKGSHTTPAIVLQTAVCDVDQARFNQLHNATDLDFALSSVVIATDLRIGWQWIAPERLNGATSGYASEKREVCELLAKHGPWGNAIALADGRVVVGGLYAACCALLKMPVLVCVVDTAREAQLRHYFGQSYGVFSYEPVERTPWVQSMAQMHRLRGPKTKSRTYENLVIPRLSGRESPRVLDFGAGQMDYVRHLRENGVNIVGFEPYFRSGFELDIGAIHRHVDELCKTLEREGLFDLVVCDSVVNSVDSQSAEDDVLTCLNAFCRLGGTIVWSGRNRQDQRLKSDEKRQVRTGRSTTLGFFDGDGLTALARKQGWQFQKFHTLEQVENHAERFFGPEWAIYSQEGILQRAPGQPGVSDRPAWGAIATKERELCLESIEAALRREFDMPLPGGRSLGRAEDVLAAWRIAASRKEKPQGP